MSEDPALFYTQRLPDQFNRALDDARERDGGEGRTYRELARVDATIEARVEGVGCWYLDIEAGRMSVHEAPRHAPFLTLVHEPAAFAALERAAGASAMRFLGAVAGLGRELRLTRERVDALREVGGCVRVTLRGDDGFTLLAHFGAPPLPAEPHCHISIDADVAAQLQAGSLDVEDAFLGGRIDIEGDVQKAMQLALAVMAGD